MEMEVAHTWALQRPYPPDTKLHEVFGVGTVIVHTVHHCSPSHNAFVCHVGLQGYAVERALAANCSLA